MNNLTHIINVVKQWLNVNYKIHAVPA